MVKFRAKVQLKAEMLQNISPNRSNDLWLNRTLHAPISTAEMVVTRDATVVICPVTPTGLLKVFPMSRRRSLVRIPGVNATKYEMIREGRRNLAEARSSSE